MSCEKIPYRQIHLDFHTSPYIEQIGEEFVREEFADILTKAHVNSMNPGAVYPAAVMAVHTQKNQEA